ncbi:MAG: cytochrome c3 family protein [Desulfobacterales bacterium]|jgi:hypothetical protein|nr:cytochrome c3 family protein [Desulfobacteraceae bacterium]MBT4363721.1 cytochrome c3 family protein [Desulfobacteraceae bacterium]MBT7086468.1 cytochrome c3 family protein [Desulfobacterales bacterium]
MIIYDAKSNNTKKAFVLFLLLFLLSVPIVLAQPDEIILEHNRSLKDRKRPPVFFNHELHMEEIDCLDCHHRYENGENVLDEDELEDGNPAALCITCHKAEKSADLKKTFHGSCLKCHIQESKNGNNRSPRICIGCHKQKPNTHPQKQDMKVNNGKRKCFECHKQKRNTHPLKQDMEVNNGKR